MAKEKKPSKFPRAAIVGVTLIVLLVPLALYYVFYVSSQQAYFIDRSHRSLDGIGSQVAARIDGLREVVESAATRLCQPGSEENSENLNDLKAYFESLTPFGVTLKLESYSALTREEAGAPPVTASKPPITAEFKQIGSDSRLLLNYEVIADEKLRPGRFSVSASADQLLKPVAEKYLIRERRLAAEDMFDKIVVADADTGEVVFQYGPDLPITVSSSYDLVSAKGNDSAKPGEQEGKTDKESRAKVGRGMSGMTPISIAKIDYKLFFQPIQLTPPKSRRAESEGFNLTVFGLVRADYALKKTLAFTSYMLLLFAVMSVLVVTGSGPLIKLKLLGPKDRLCKRDAILVILSAFFVTTLLTLGILDAYTHSTGERQLDHQLELLSDRLSSNLRSELAYAVSQLDQLNDALHDNLTWAIPECPPTQNQPPSETKDHAYIEDLLNRGFIFDPQEAWYPYFNAVTWIDYGGQQQIKFTTHRTHTRFIDVSQRPYFIEAKEGRTWTLPDGAGDTPRTLYLDSVHSMTSGDNVAVISKQVPRRVGAGEPGERYVAAMDARLLSLYDTVLPTGYGFCIIDDAGKVLFHSDDLKNLLENFFNECRNDRGLRAAAQARTSDILDVKYLGRDHRAFITPLEGLPWTLVVFRDKQNLRTMNLETMTLAAYLCAAYASLLALALILIFVLLPGSRERRDRVWPMAENSDRYKQIFIVNSALFVIGVLLAAISNRGAFWWAILFPSLAIAHSLWLLGSRKPKLWSLPEIPWLSDWRRLYSLAFMSMIAVGCVAPTFTFFKLMREEQMKVFLRHGQMSLASRLLERQARVLALYPAPDPPVDDGAANEQFVQQRLASKLDVQEDFFFETNSNQEAIAEQEPLGGPLCWFLTTFSPFYNEVCVDSLQLARGQASDKTWTSVDAGDSVMLAVRPATTAPPASDSGSGSEPSTAASRRLVLQTKVPALISLSNPYFVPLILVFALLIAGVYFAVRFAARRIVLLDVADAKMWSINPEGEIDKNYLVVGPPSLEHSKLFLHPSFVYLDLGGSSQETWWKIRSRIDKDTLCRPVVLDRFDANKNDFKGNELKLELIEGLLTENKRRLVIISAVSPAEFPLTDVEAAARESAQEPKVLAVGAGTAPSLSPAPAAKPDAQRWAEALQSFARATAIDGDDPKTRGLLKAPPEDRDPILKEPVGPENEELVAKEADQLEMYYRGIWSACSQDEKMTLFRVAKDGLVSRFDPHLRPLMMRGLIVRNPSLSLTFPSFRVFVLGTCVVEGVDTLQADELSHWERWKLPLIVVLFTMIGFLFITQKELYDNTVYVVTGVTGGLMALLRLIGLFQPKSAGAAGAQS